MNFKIGDKVRRIGESSTFDNRMKKGNIYTIKYIDNRDIEFVETEEKLWDINLFELVKRNQTLKELIGDE